MIINIVLTPAILSSFGIDRYGLFLLSTTIVFFVGSFDGGFGNSMTRWAAINAARGDHAATTRLLTTVLLVVAVIGGSLSALLFFAAPALMNLFDVPDILVDEGVVLLRTMAFVVGVSQVRSLFAAQLSAHQRFAWQSLVSIGSYLVYAGGLILTVRYDAGLRGVAITYAAQALVATVLILGGSIRFLDRRAIGLVARSELREFLSYSARVQALGLTGIIGNQIDTFVVGRALSVGSVAVYGTGLNFSNQLRTVPINVLVPISTTLSQAYGRGGHDEALAVFTSVQRRWVQGSTAWCAVAFGAAYFGISSWLGDRFELAGVVACMLTLANAVNLWTGALTTLLVAVGRPGLEVRYAVVSLLVNVTLTVPGVVLFGILGTVGATCIGSIVGSLYLVRVARHQYDPDIRAFTTDVPVLPALATVATVLGLELLAQPLVPNGALGLLLSGLVAAPGFLVFGLLLMGPAATWRMVAKGVRKVTSCA